LEVLKTNVSTHLFLPIVKQGVLTNAYPKMVTRVTEQVIKPILPHKLAVCGQKVDFAGSKYFWKSIPQLRLYPNAHYQGLADGAPENWTFLNSVTATQILDFYHAEMEIIQPKRVSKSVVEGFHDAITYFRNHHHQMHYVEAIAANLPIGSGITEAACKVIIKARLCCSGMKWKDRCDRISIK
jgi:hypothetical protein